MKITDCVSTCVLGIGTLLLLGFIVVSARGCNEHNTKVWRDTQQKALEEGSEFLPFDADTPRN